MRKMLLETASLVALGAAAPAMAADLAARPYTKAPPMLQADYDWSGFYVGLNGGGGTSHKCWDVSSVESEGCHDATGGTVGREVGYRWQTGPICVRRRSAGQLGRLHRRQCERDLPGRSHSHQDRCVRPVHRSGGYAWNNALLYVKGGAAVVDDKYTIVTNPGSGADRLRQRDALGWRGRRRPRVWLRAELVGRASSTTTCSWARSPTASSRRSAPFAGTDNIKQEVDLFTARINYRFGGPVVGRY